MALRGTAGQLDAVAGRLVGAVAVVHLVQGPQLLAVVERRSDHRPPLQRVAPRRGRGQQRRGRLRRMGDQHPRVAARFGVDADDGLAVQILGNVGHESVLADNHDDVFGGETKVVEIAPLDLGAPPIGRDRRRRHLPRLESDGVPGGEHPDRPATALEEERSLLAGAVAHQQLLVLGAAIHLNHPRLEAHAASVPAPAAAPPPAKRAMIGVSRSGVMARFSMLGRFLASS